MCLFKIHHSTPIPKSVTEHLANIDHSLANIDHSLANIAKENQEEEYTKYSNLISIISTTLTLLGILGTIFGAFLLYSYLKDIEALHFFPQSISSTSLFGFFIVYFLINVFVYIVIILPSIIIYINTNNKKTSNESYRKKIAFGYSLPMLVSLLFFLSFYFCEFDIKHASLLFFLIIIIVSLVTLYLVWDALKGENKKVSCQKVIEVLLYVIFIGFYSFLIIALINKDQDDFIYFFYAIGIFFLSLFSNFLSAKNIKNNNTNFKTLIIDKFLLLVLSTLIVPFFIYQACEAYNEYFNQKVKTAYSYRVMQAFGYADKSDKIYFIEQQFVEREIKAEPINIYKNVNIDNITITNSYKAYCGRIYWRSNDITVFKRNNDDNYKKIPDNKIFESQNSDFYCTKEGVISRKTSITSVVYYITNGVRKITEKDKNEQILPNIFTH